MIKMTNVCIFYHNFFKKVKCEYSTCVFQRKGDASKPPPTFFFLYSLAGMRTQSTWWWATFQTTCMGQQDQNTCVS